MFRDSESRMRAITDSAQDAILMMDPQGRVSYWNPAAQRILGYTSEEAAGRNLHELIVPKCYHQAHREALPEFQRSGRGGAVGKTTELCARRKDGQEIFVALSLSAVQAKGGWHAVGILRDITAQKQTLEALRDAVEQAERSTKELDNLNRQLEAAVERANLMAQEAVVANQAKSEFLANMSHEIRTPMNGIVGFSDMLAGSPLTVEQQQYVTIIQDCTRNLLQIIGDILDFSKIEARKMTVEIVDCSLPRLLTSIDLLMAPKANAKGLAFGVRMENLRPPDEIRTDPVRLRQCLINLVGNAMKFTEQGSVYLHVRQEDAGCGPLVRFDVVDTGIGIPLDRQREIFDPFVQADSSTTRKHGGTGLGLTITRQLAELLGGRVNLRSEEGKGSTFSLILPAGKAVTEKSPASRDDVVPDKPEYEGHRQQNFSGRILMAEDVPTNQLLMKLMLERLGLEVEIVEDGDKVVERALQSNFDLILMDIQMPGKNGYEATCELRQHKITIPIIALTAHAMEGDRQKCISAGCNDYLAKPVEREKLLKMLDEYLPSEQSPQYGESTLAAEVAGASDGENEARVSEADPAVSQEAPVVDWDRLMDRIADENLIAEIMPICVQDNKDRLQQLTLAVEQDDAGQVRSYAHAIKGASANLEATILSHAARSLERAAAAGDLSDSSRLLHDVATAFERFEAFVSRPDWMEIAKRRANERQLETVNTTVTNTCP